jgi:hypothetical protein
MRAFAESPAPDFDLFGSSWCLGVLAPKAFDARDPEIPKQNAVDRFTAGRREASAVATLDRSRKEGYLLEMLITLSGSDAAIAGWDAKPEP